MLLVLVGTSVSLSKSLLFHTNYVGAATKEQFQALPTINSLFPLANIQSIVFHCLDSNPTIPCN